MNIARVSRPASVALATVASALFLAGFTISGVMVGFVAVGAAWVRPPAPPAD